MALDFPASPTVGQTFTAAGTTWSWDGVKWTTVLGAPAAYVQKSGDTMTGLLVVSDPASQIQIRGSVPDFPYLTLNKGTDLVNDWGGIALSQGAPGAPVAVWDFGYGAPNNALQLSRYNPPGTHVDTPFRVSNANGDVTILNSIRAPGIVGRVDGST